MKKVAKRLFLGRTSMRCLCLFVFMVGLLFTFETAAVDAPDISILRACDFDGDGVVGVGDLNLLLDNWATDPFLLTVINY